MPKFIMGGTGTGPLGIMLSGGECKPGKYAAGKGWINPVGLTEEEVGGCM